MSDLLSIGDLQYAEALLSDARTALRRAAQDLHLFHARGNFADCRKEACVRARDELAALDGYCRTSCRQEADGTWRCGGVDDGCECPGTDHSDEHGQ